MDEINNQENKFDFYVGVKFNNASRAYFFGVKGIDLKLGDKVVVETVHGPELGEVTFEPISIEEYKSVLELRPVLRKATPTELKLHEINLKDAQFALEICKNEVKIAGKNL